MLGSGLAENLKHNAFFPTPSYSSLMNQWILSIAFSQANYKHS